MQTAFTHRWRHQASTLAITPACLLPSFCACVQDYVDQLAAELEATKHTGGDEASDRMLDLIQECSTLSLSLCVINPMSMLRFQTTRLDQPAEPGLLGEPEKPPKPSCSPKCHWARIEVRHVELACVLGEAEMTCSAGHVSALNALSCLLISQIMRKMGSIIKRGCVVTRAPSVGPFIRACVLSSTYTPFGILLASCMCSHHHERKILGACVPRCDFCWSG